MKDFCLTIAGSDPSSGAGIQADIRTFDRCGVHPFSIITAITYQTATKFFGYSEISKENLKKQLDAILKTYPVKFVKIGMIPSINSLNVIVDHIKSYKLNVILDPVTVSSAGKRLAENNLEFYIEKELLPNIIVLTPNILEAQIYSGINLQNCTREDHGDLKRAAIGILKKMHENGDLSNPENIEKALIIKSAGLDKNKIFDFILLNKKNEDGFTQEFQILDKRKVDFKGNIHGTGCVFSSALAAFLAKGNSLKNGIKLAEEFFDEKFQNFIELPDQGRVIDLTVTGEKLKVMNQIKEIYNYLSRIKKFSKLIPEVRLNVSGSLPNATNKQDIAGIEGRITIIGGFPKASGDIKFGVSDHTARLILTAKEFDNSINFVMNLRYKDKYVKKIKEKTDLFLHEFIRETQPDQIRKKEHSTMQWLIKESVKSTGRIPDIIWDKGAFNKEAMMRLFGKSSKNMLNKLSSINEALF